MKIGSDFLIYSGFRPDFLLYFYLEKRWFVLIPSHLRRLGLLRNSLYRERRFGFGLIRTWADEYDTVL